MKVSLAFVDLQSELFGVAHSEDMQEIHISDPPNLQIWVYNLVSGFTNSKLVKSLQRVNW